MVYHLKCLSCHSVSKVEILRMGIAAAKKIKDKFLSSSSLYGVIPNIRFFSLAFCCEKQHCWAKSPEQKFVAFFELNLPLLLQISLTSFGLSWILLYKEVLKP